jgi:chitinase
MRLNARWSRRTFGVIVLVCGLCRFTLPVDGALWSTGYYPGWEQGAMPPSNIDFSTLTHIIHFSVLPNSNGTLNSGANGLSASYSADLVTRAHAAGKAVLICVGGAGSESDFLAATTVAVLPAFVSSLTNFMATRGYDGVDLDWEPLPASDSGPFTNLVNSLRSALDRFPQHKLLTAAVGAYPPYGDPPTAEYALFATLQDQFDQINIMTYDLAGPYPGWVTWFNSPIYDGGFRFPSTGSLLPSVDGAVHNFISNGVAPAKLGIGIAFYGYIWAGGSGTSTGGVTEPRQSWTNAPTVSTPSYNEIMSGYYQSNRYHWDDSAQAAYLSITNPNPANDMFVSYDDPRTCQCKVSYARNNGLGGVMIWELAQDYQQGQPDPLLLALKQALATPGSIGIQDFGQNIALSFTGLPLGSYRVEWNKDLSSNAWNTLTVTNLSGPAGLLEILDPAAPTQSQRFYRIQTPP